jgi:hypothetical protein
MKRDMELIREIALRIEEAPGGFAPQPFGVDGYSDEQVGYHVLLMMEGGLLHGFEVTSMNDSTPLALPNRLTWAGHEFIDAAREATRWEKTKALLARAGGASFPVWMEALTRAAISSIGLP